MYEPEVTVITPTSNIVENNQADDFTLLVNLLDRQTYEYIEHLIIDNASKDGTEVLLKDYKNAGFLSFFSEPDRGKFDAMNKGILRAKGKYVSFLSCDDFYHDITAIADIVNVMEEEDADFCFFPSYCCHPEGYAFQFVPAMLNAFQVSPCPRQAMFFKKSVLTEIGSFDEKFKLLADYDLIIRLLLRGYKGVLFEGNVCLRAGSGWGAQRPDKNTPAHIKSWTVNNPAKNFVIRDNIFAYTTHEMFEISFGLQECCPIMRDNVVIH